MTKEDLDAIKAKMRERKVSQADLAWRAGCSPSWVSSVLNGHYPYSYAASAGRAILPLNIERALQRTGVIEGSTQ
jgi:transcriptional regulator with XRE-family HTH domain